MRDTFAIQGNTLELADLIKLQAMATDLARTSRLRSSARRAGDQRSRSLGQGREFAELKPYVAGHDVRQIDWRVTARRQSPYVRIMEEDRHHEHTVWLDLSASSYFGTTRCFKAIMLVHWAAFLVWRLLHLKHPVRLFIQVGEWQSEQRYTQAKQGAQACGQLFEAYQQLVQHFATANTVASPWPLYWRDRPNVWLLTDGQQWPADQLTQAFPLTKVTRLTVLQCVDPFDAELPLSENLPVQVGSAVKWINTQQPEYRLAHQRRFAQQQQALKNHAAICNGQLLTFTTPQFNWQEVISWPLYH